MIKCEIVADSINPVGCRITSFLLTYPRFIHSELMTHRQFSRNAASSRAIPLKKMIDRVEADPAMPIHWGAEQKGMQSGDSLEGSNLETAKSLWLQAARSAASFAALMGNINLHKSIANRVLEPFAHMTTLVTATDYANFFNLRAHPAAQPEFQALAYLMLDAYEQNVPEEKSACEWHLPFADKYISEGLTEEQLIKISTARAARTSYLNMSNEIDHEKDYALHDQLMASGHWSPFEHAAAAADDSDRRGNFRGWRQWRKFFPSECGDKITAKRKGV